MRKTLKRAMLMIGIAYGFAWLGVSVASALYILDFPVLNWFTPMTPGWLMLHGVGMTPALILYAVAWGRNDPSPNSICNWNGENQLALA